MVKIVIAGTTYEFPEVGEHPNWGREATEVIVALSDALGSLIVDGDILISQTPIANNVSIDSIINGLIFDSNKTQSAAITYTARRSTDTEFLVETGRIFITYNDAGLVGEKWIMTQLIDSGDAGIIFNLTDDGRFFYKSSDVTGGSYNGVLTFQARTLLR